MSISQIEKVDARARELLKLYKEYVECNEIEDGDAYFAIDRKLQAEFPTENTRAVLQGYWNYVPSSFIGSTTGTIACVSLAPRPLPVPKDDANGEFKLQNFLLSNKYMGRARPQSWLVENLIEEGSMCGFVAAGGVGKTWLMLDLCLKLGSGQGSFLGFPIKKQCSVVLVTVEDDPQSVLRRLESLDPNFELRKASSNMYIITASEMGGSFTLGEYNGSRQLTPTFQFKFLTQGFSYLKQFFSHKPILVIFDTYSATHHADENSSVGANEWFKLAGKLRSDYKATVVVTHHIRKVGYNEPLRGPEDFEMAIRGSSAFVNSCRTVLGIWPMRDNDSKHISSINPDTRLFNFSLIKDNNGPNWGDKDLRISNRPVTTLLKDAKGFLRFDEIVNDEMKKAYIVKKEMSEDDKLDLQKHLHDVIKFYSDAQYPLAVSVFDKTQSCVSVLSPEHSKRPLKVIRTSITAMVAKGELVIKEIKINNRNCKIYDVPKGKYATCELVERIGDDLPQSPFRQLSFSVPQSSEPLIKDI